MKSADSGFAPANGLNVYYEIHGEGQPLIMLHGGVSASEAFGQNLIELAKTRKVIALHLKGTDVRRTSIARSGLNSWPTT